MDRSTAAKVRRDRLYAGINRALSEELQTSFYYITLQPAHWQAEYIIDAPQASDGGGALETTVRYTGFSPDGAPNETIDLYADQLCRDGWEPDRLQAAAASILSGTPFRLGNLSAASSGPPAHWRLDGAEHPLKHIQVALDFACHCGCDLVQLGKMYPEHGYEVEGDSGRVLIARNYLQRRGLVRHAADATAFLAEYILAVGGRLDTRPCAGSLDLYLLPLRVLGQYRAAACWIRPPRRNGCCDDIRKSQIMAWEQLLAEGTIDLWGDDLVSAVTDRTRNVSGSETALFESFAGLWWAREIRAYRGPDCVLRLVRDANGDLTGGSREKVTRPSGRQPIAVRSGDDGCKMLLLDLSRHIKRSSGADLGEDWVREMLGFDLLEFDVPLLMIEPEELAWLGEHLIGRRISSILHLAQAKASASRVRTIDAVSHGMKHAIAATGWRHSLEKIQSKDKDALIWAESSLSLYEIAEGLGSLLRLWTTCEGRDFSKIVGWSSQGQIERWDECRPEDFDLYAYYIERYAIALCCGLGMHDGFQLTLTGREGQTTSRIISTSRTVGGSLTSWINKSGALPPLSCCENTDSHVTLLATLIEPLTNAIKYMDRSRSPSLLITIADERPAAIRVDVANAVTKKTIPMPPSISKLIEIYHQTRIAVMDVPELDQADRIYTVRVKLTPQILARSIVRQLPEEKRWAAN